MSVRRKRVSEPWLQLIKDGLKTYDGRVCQGDWDREHLHLGDQLNLFNDQDPTGVVVEVIDLQYFPTFGEAWLHLGSQLIPYEYIVRLTSLDAPHNIDYIYQLLLEPFYKEKHLNYTDVLQHNGIVAVGIRLK
jgi:ASC-1-like (ASCH) protein